MKDTDGIQLKTDFKSKYDAKAYMRSEVDAARGDRQKAYHAWEEAHRAYKNNPTPEMWQAQKDAANAYKEAKQNANKRADNARGDYKNYMESAKAQENIDKNKALGDKANTPESGDETTKEDSGMSKSGSGFRFSDTFYRDLGAAASDRKAGNTYDQAAEMMRNQARVESNAAANNEKQAQRAEQTAGRNINAVADERAVASQQSQDKQRINKAKTTGANTALLRSEVASDPAAAQAEKVEQQKIAAERQDKADEHKFEAAQKDGMANELEVRSRDNDTWLDRTGRLARGEGEPDVAKEPEQPAPEPEQQPAPEPEQQQPLHYNAQHVINGLLGAGKGADLRNGSGSGDDQAMYNWVVKNMGVTPITPKSNNANDWENEFIQQQGSKAQEVMNMLRAGRSPNDSSKNFNIGSKDYNEMTGRQVEWNQPQNQQQGQPVQAYAEGTDNAAPGVALVGEKGPELVVMQGGEKVIPNNETEDVFGKMLIKYLNEDYDGGIEPSNNLKKLFLRYNNIGADDDGNISDDILSALSGYIQKFANDNRPVPTMEEEIAGLKSQLADIQARLEKLGV